ncbi:MAG: hypothetical protein JW774_09380 [Candidatus Aureabacteria bacterium]|nr:hypothetical protein [Candidatus Auribacterota bacterium]
MNRKKITYICILVLGLIPPPVSASDCRSFSLSPRSMLQDLFLRLSETQTDESERLKVEQEYGGLIVPEVKSILLGLGSYTIEESLDNEQDDIPVNIEVSDEAHDAEIERNADHISLMNYLHGRAEKIIKAGNCSFDMEKMYEQLKQIHRANLRMAAEMKCLIDMTNPSIDFTSDLYGEFREISGHIERGGYQRTYYKVLKDYYSPATEEGDIAEQIDPQIWERLQSRGWVKIINGITVFTRNFTDDELLQIDEALTGMAVPDLQGQKELLMQAILYLQKKRNSKAPSRLYMSRLLESSNLSLNGLSNILTEVMRASSKVKAHATADERRNEIYKALGRLLAAYFSQSEDMKHWKFEYDEVQRRVNVTFDKPEPYNMGEITMSFASTEQPAAMEMNRAISYPDFFSLIASLPNTPDNLYELNHNLRMDLPDRSADEEDLRKQEWLSACSRSCAELTNTDPGQIQNELASNPWLNALEAEEIITGGGKVVLIVKVRPGCSLTLKDHRGNPVTKYAGDRMVLNIPRYGTNNDAMRWDAFRMEAYRSMQIDIPGVMKTIGYSGNVLITEYIEGQPVDQQIGIPSMVQHLEQAYRELNELQKQLKEQPRTDDPSGTKSDLSARIEKKKQDLQDFCDIYPVRMAEMLLQLILSLQYLHDELGLSHNDLKWENIYLSSFKGLMQWLTLFDFGSMGYHDIYNPYAIQATPQDFFASELVVRSRNTSPTSDMFLVGQILFHLISGEKYFWDNFLIKLFHKIRDQKGQTVLAMPNAHGNFFEPQEWMSQIIKLTVNRAASIQDLIESSPGISDLIKTDEETDLCNPDKWRELFARLSEEELRLFMELGDSPLKQETTDPRIFAHANLYTLLEKLEKFQELEKRFQDSIQAKLDALYLLKNSVPEAFKQREAKLTQLYETHLSFLNDTQQRNSILFAGKPVFLDGPEPALKAQIQYFLNSTHNMTPFTLLYYAMENTHKPLIQQTIEEIISEKERPLYSRAHITVQKELELRSTVGQFTASTADLQQQMTALESAAPALLKKWGEHYQVTDDATERDGVQDQFKDVFSLYQKCSQSYQEAMNNVVRTLEQAFNQIIDPQVQAAFSQTESNRLAELMVRLSEASAALRTATEKVRSFSIESAELSAILNLQEALLSGFSKAALAFGDQLDIEMKVASRLTMTFDNNPQMQLIHSVIRHLLRNEPEKKDAAASRVVYDLIAYLTRGNASRMLQIREPDGTPSGQDQTLFDLIKKFGLVHVVMSDPWGGHPYKVKPQIEFKSLSNPHQPGPPSQIRKFSELFAAEVARLHLTLKKRIEKASLDIEQRTDLADDAAKDREEVRIKTEWSLTDDEEKFKRLWKDVYGITVEEWEDSTAKKLGMIILRPSFEPVSRRTLRPPNLVPLRSA